MKKQEKETMSLKGQATSAGSKESVVKRLQRELFGENVKERRDTKT